MTEESLDVTSDINSVSLVPEDDSSSTISKNAEDEGGRVTRKTADSIAATPSRYLSSSVRSCHHSCKYGTKHTFETTKRATSLKRIKDKKCEGNDSEKKQNVVEGLGCSSGSECQKRDTSTATERTKRVGQKALDPPIGSIKGVSSKTSPNLTKRSKDEKPKPEPCSVVSNSVMSNTKEKNESPSRNGGLAKRLSPSLSASSHAQKIPISSPKDRQKKIAKSSQNWVLDTKDGARVRRSPISSVTSSSASTSSISKRSKPDANNKAVKMDRKAVESKPRAPKIRAANPEDKDSTPRKLDFRKGKVVEIQHEINIPRRLKFRRRIVSERQNGMLGSRNSSLKSSEVQEAETTNTNLESKKVILRHQNVGRKEVVQILFNNVIEETANKLVQSRKSKVKALVGAFETVISLQETKPASTISAC